MTSIIDLLPASFDALVWQEPVDETGYGDDGDDGDGEPSADDVMHAFDAAVDADEDANACWRLRHRGGFAGLSAIRIFSLWELHMFCGQPSLRTAYGRAERR